MNLSEILYKLGEDREKYFNAVCPPIMQSSNFTFDSLDDFRKAYSDELKSSLFSILLKTNEFEKAEAFFNHLKHFLFAVSWGGHESLVLPFCAFYNVPNRPDSTQPFNLVRMYIGLEDPDWLIADLAQALEVL